MTEDDEIRFQEADCCHICEKKYKIGDVPVRDHSHITGAFRGSSHSNCNLQYQENRVVPVIFHNLSHYDSHFIIKKLSLSHGGNVSVLPLNDELYISFTKSISNQRCL